MKEEEEKEKKKTQEKWRQRRKRKREKKKKKKRREKNATRLVGKEGGPQKTPCQFLEGHLAVFAWDDLLG